MNAQQAREKSDSSQGDRQILMIALIDNLIDVATNKGAYSVNVNDYRLGLEPTRDEWQSIITHYGALGYEVDPNVLSVSISW